MPTVTIRLLRPVGAAFLAASLVLGGALLDVPGGLSSPSSMVNPAPRPAEAAETGLVDPGFLRDYAETYRFRLGRPASIQVLPGGEAVLFRRSEPRSFVHDLWLFDPTTGRERRLLSAEDLLRGADETLTPEEKARRERQRLVSRGVASYQVSEDGERLLVPMAGELHVQDLYGETVRDGRVPMSMKRLTLDAGRPIDPRFSPDATRIACVVDGDLHVVHVGTGLEIRLTERESETVTHGLAEFVAQEEMDRDHGYWWSPDGRRIAYQRTDTAGMERFHIADPMHPEKEPDSWPYPRPGGRNADVRLGVVAADGGPTTWIDWDRTRYPYVGSVTWEKNAPLTVLVQDRTQTEEVLLAVDPETGAPRTLLVETDAAWLNLDPSMPRWLPDGAGFLWSTERNGAWEVELRGADGSQVRTVVPAELGYRRLLGYDEDGRALLVRVNGDGPARSTVVRVPLDGGDPVPLTPEPGYHTATFSRDGAAGVLALGPLDGPARWSVVTSEGRELGGIASIAEAPELSPDPEFVRVGADPEMEAVVLRPAGFTPGSRYPVILHVYGGPHAQMVTHHRDRYRFGQWLANEGFIVVSADGRGTPSRGRAWERAIRSDLMTLPLNDQITALTALGERFPEMDLDRVGVYGWSFGGYFSAMAAMRNPDVFHAAVAGAPVADFGDYDTHYTERYLGIPQDDPEAYARSSVLTYADRLERPLLVVHGTADDNVYFLHALKLSNALFRAGKPHEFLPLSGFTHMVPDPTVTIGLYGRIVGFFRDELGAGSSDRP